jgi:hypothetical protein
MESFMQGDTVNCLYSNNYQFISLKGFIGLDSYMDSYNNEQSKLILIDKNEKVKYYNVINDSWKVITCRFVLFEKKFDFKFY